MRCHARSVGLTRIALVLSVGVTLLAGCARSPEVAADSQQQPTPDWDDPLVNGVEVSTVDETLSLLQFEPRVPSELGDPARLLITDPTSAEVVFRDFAAVFDHPSYGRFWLIERVAELTQDELRSWSNCDPAAGCEGVWTLVDIGPGTEGILIEGPVATSVVWLSTGVRYDVVGPAQTLTGEAALEIAGLVVSSDGGGSP